MNFPERELEVLKRWERDEIFKKTLEKPAPKGPFVFYDGPPFATGLPHYGHIVASVMKDVVPRFWTMRGYHVDRKWGWDCHGLPIENIVEKKFDLGSKKAIEDFGVAKFNDSCHAEVMTYAKEWKTVIHRLGRWVDMENDYKTMDLSFMESIWWVFKTLWDKGNIYQGHKPIHICPRCETVLSKFEVNQGYQDVKDISVVVTFPITSGVYEGVKILAWTTTPWTLPGNVLLAVHPKMVYTLVTSEGVRYFVAKELIEKVFAGKEYQVNEEMNGSDLIGATYEPLFPFFKDHEGAFRVVAGDFVTAEEGTGIVHIAPGFGSDDYDLGKKEEVKPIFHVLMNGHFVSEVAEPLAEAGYAVKDVPVKKKGDTMSVDIELVKALAHAGRLFAKQKFEHSYPNCWRCDTPLLNYATSSWFVRVESKVPELMRSAQMIRWVPEHIKDGRFGKGLEGSPDWSVSRSRFWGTPLPIWKSEDGEFHVVGSVAELQSLTGKTITNLHKQYVDALTFEKNGKTFTRIPEVLDCWFESGSMPYAQLHYPFENKERFEKGFPAEFIAEGVDQTSLWFHKLHVIANLLFHKPAFKNVIVNGIVLAEDGKKMSKRLRNYPDPMEVMEKYGSDSVRYYLMSSPVVQAENLRFSEKDVTEVSRRFVNIFLNVVSFYQLYKHEKHGEGRSSHVLDRWILARLHESLKQETQAMEAYDLQAAARVLQVFVTDLSTWYVRRSRERMKTEGHDREQALATLRMVLETFAKMCAPFTPFLAEMVFGDVGHETSVHMEDWPAHDDTLIDEAVLEEMDRTRSIVSKALERRSEAGINVRQVLGGMTVMVPSGEMAEEYQDLVRDEVNVKSIEVKKGENGVELDLTMTPELVREGTVREIIRRVNDLRKTSGLTIEDRIALYVSGEPEILKAVQEHQDLLLRGTLSTSVHTQGAVPEISTAFRVNEFDITVGFAIM
ncbi:isoleucine--tRNA ligase [Candidatus Uhrbacteria bacterium]|nr:isoleucine--tRNA ligase [Candidatus Uhrbacteria bacterium]